MKIAISTDNGFVSAHFGRCPEFTIVDIENGEIKNQEVIANPGHHPGFLPQFLKDKGVGMIVAGGMGQRAQMLFSEHAIDAVMGIDGPVEKVIQEILTGNLRGGESLCKPGAGKGYGLDKTVCDHPDDGHHQDKEEK